MVLVHACALPFTPVDPCVAGCGDSSRNAHSDWSREPGIRSPAQDQR